MRYPSVTSLPIHLNDNQQVYFDEEANLENVQNNPSPTALKSFFLYNEQNEVGINNDVTYIDFPSKFVWKKDSKVWSIRDNQNPSVRIASIGRLPFLTPAHGDVFYLRTLLHHDHCKGKKSFIAMRTYKNHVYPNYKQVCFELGLLADDNEWRKCLEEADLESSPKRLRNIFATIIIYNRPGNVFALLCDFLDQLGED